MPMVSYYSQDSLHAQMKMFEKLKIAVRGCDLLDDEKLKGFYILKVHDVGSRYSSDDGPAWIAFAQYDDELHTYAIYAPDYFTQEQFATVEFLLRDIPYGSRIVVFSQECYDKAMEWNDFIGESAFDVHLCVQS